MANKILPQLTPKRLVDNDGTATREFRSNDEDIKKSLADLWAEMEAAKARLDAGGL